MFILSILKINPKEVKMIKESEKVVRELMGKLEQIRNIGIVAHI